ncbi:MAG TPA: glycosyltransferase family 2 protein [Candidatus Bathyarchaeia archaeon]|nr:glycosyltransferase family 2 protein [Candidatus Bathyarchaeia archaeon]
MRTPSLDLTVIIPSYNTRALLRNCIDSIYRYTEGIAFEIICVDGNSPDGSAEMVAREFPEVVLIQNAANESYARSVNQGLRRSRGRYTCLLDSDTLLIEDTFGPMLRFMDEHPEAAACGPKLLNPDRTLQHDIRRFADLSVFFLQTLNWHKLFPNSRIMRRYYASDFDFSRAQQVQAIGTSVFVMRRSTWQTAGLLDERFRWAMVDLAYEYMLGKKGYKLYYTPCAEVVHYGSQTANQDVLKTLREQCQGMIDFSDNYDYFGKNRLLKAIVRLGVRFRYYSKVLGYFVSSDKRVIKGPGRPGKKQFERGLLVAEGKTHVPAVKERRKEAAVASFSQSGSDANSVATQ